MTQCISGLGLHSGRDVSVVLRAGSPGSGIRCFVGDNPRPFLLGNQSQIFQLESPRTTVILHDGWRIRTPEHFLAALLGWAYLDLDVHVRDAEFPIGQGCASIWTLALSAEFGRPRFPQVYDCSLRERFEFGYGFWEVEPWDGGGILIDLSLDQHGFSERISLWLRGIEDLAPLWEARTFIFQEDYLVAKAQGMLAGAKDGCGVVVQMEGGNMQVLHGSPLRHAHELCLHKAMDLLGDLALLRLQLPKLRIRIHNGGHAAHHHLIQRIQSLCP